MLFSAAENKDTAVPIPCYLDGYMGGRTRKPTYEQVCAGKTGHAEAVEVEYDPTRVDFEALTKQFFEMHDAAEAPRGKGYQYRSAVFCTDETQKETVKKLIELLAAKGVTVHTEVRGVARFWPAEDYHQNYYQKQGQQPTCHRPTKLFDE